MRPPLLNDYPGLCKGCAETLKVPLKYAPGTALGKVLGEARASRYELARVAFGRPPEVIGL